MRKLSTIILLALSISTSIDECYAQATAEGINSCLAELKAIVKAEKKEADKAMSSGKGWQMNFSFTAIVPVPNSDEYTEVNTQGEVISTENFKYVKEDQFEIYMDEVDVFTLNNTDRSIMRSASFKSAIRYQSNPFFDLQNDSLLRLYNFNACTKVYDTVLKMNLRCFTILPVDEKKAVYKRLEIYVDEKGSMVKKIQAWSNTELFKGIVTCTTIINNRGTWQSNNMRAPVKDIFITSNGQLKEQYRKYRYRDLKK